ncbi:restriction endonuclease subunit S, partial [bacterium]|nr:restriction endonuclease subunit S [bacterium]
MKWPTIIFTQIVKDITGGQRKIQKKVYLPEGHIPVVDQGQELISGYTDDETAVFNKDLPVVLFGDHTRIIKFVDFPFALGADGVKVLHPLKHLHSKFLYFFLNSVEIPSRGYSRHFKFLKEISIPVPPPSEQQRIVEILDQADALREKRAEADARAERILPALFYKMFGDPVTNPKDWDVTNLSHGGATVRYGLGQPPEPDPDGIPLIRATN